MAIVMLLAATLLSLQNYMPDQEPEEIVVTAKPQGCRSRLADRELSDKEFDSKVREWSRGVPVRVVAASTADIKCLSKIAFHLADKGVKKLEFVDPNGRPARPFVAAGPSTAYANSVEERERSFITRRAAQMILEGKCAEARQLVLEKGELAAAADVVQICQAK